MPLKTGTSKKAFGENVRTEMGAGKPQKQALAIAYAKQREAMKRKKMWEGGDVSDDGDHDGMASMYGDSWDEHHELKHHNSSGEPHTNDKLEEEHPMEYMFEGGEVGSSNFKTDPAKKQDKYPMPKQGSLEPEESYSGHQYKQNFPYDARYDQEVEKLAHGGMVEGLLKKKKMMFEGGEVGGSAGHMDQDEDDALHGEFDDHLEDVDYGPEGENPEMIESDKPVRYAHGGKVKAKASHMLAAHLKKKMRGF